MISDMMNKEFWKSAFIRAFKTFLQVILGGWTAGQLITEIDWKYLLTAAVSAAIYSFVMSLAAGLPEVKYKEALVLIKEDRGEPIVNAEEPPEEEEE